MKPDAKPVVNDFVAKGFSANKKDQQGLQTMPFRNKALTVLPPAAIAVLVVLGTDAFAANAAAEGGISGIFSTYGQSRAIVFGILGAGGTFAAGLLWFATFMGKRRARRTVAAYDAQIAKYKHDLRKHL